MIDFYHYNNLVIQVLIDFLLLLQTQNRVYWTYCALIIVALTFQRQRNYILDLIAPLNVHSCLLWNKS